MQMLSLKIYLISVVALSLTKISMLLGPCLSQRRFLETFKTRFPLNLKPIFNILYAIGKPNFG